MKAGYDVAVYEQALELTEIGLAYRSVPMQCRFFVKFPAAIRSVTGKLKCNTPRVF
jgi:hypothetical protein